MNVETVVPIVISAISLALSIFKYMDKSKEKINAVSVDVELLKLKVEQASDLSERVEKDILEKIGYQKKQLEKLMEKLDEIKDELND